MSSPLSQPSPDRKGQRNCTVAVGGKMFDPLERDEAVLRKAERSNSLPMIGSKRGDVEISQKDQQELAEKQTHIKGRVRRGSIFLGSVSKEELISHWDAFDGISIHVHGKLSSIPSDNIPGAEREAVLYKSKEPNDLPDKHQFVYSSIKGAKGHNDTTPNQDSFSFTVFKGWNIIIVMDGHGPCGHHVSDRVVQTIPYYFSKNAMWEEGDDPSEKDIHASFKDAFMMSSKDLLGFAIESDIDVQGSGSTCVLFMQKGTVYYTANVGDSRVLLGYEDSKEVVFETLDHKPGVEEERERIEASGGEIRTLRYDDFTVDRIFVAGRDYPGLCMSRSFGDECVKAHGVISEPECCSGTVDLSRKPFVVVASDGVWEFIDSGWCIKAMVKKLPVESPARIVQKLSKESKRRWRQEEGDYCDDITVCFMRVH